MTVKTDLYSTIQHVKLAMAENELKTAIPLVIQIVDELKNSSSFFELKTTLNSLLDDEAIYIIRALDAALMDRYSQFLIRNLHKYHSSITSKILYCYELMEKNRYIEAEGNLEVILEIEGLTLKEKRLALTAIINLLIDMRRFQEAKSYLQELESIAEEPIYDRWGYYYFRLGNWNKAKKFVNKGIDLDSKPQYSFIILQSIYTAEGDLASALDIINKGIERTPYYYPLILEKAQKLKYLQNNDQFLEVLNHIETITPHHMYKKYFEYSRGEILYRSSQYEQLKPFILKYPAIFKDSVYENKDNFNKENIKILPTTIVLQKYNYCVPATITMLLSRYGIQKHQDEIAEKIYHINGSKLISATSYLEENGMVCQHFFGRIDLYKKLTDLQVSVIIGVNYPNSSHVQLLVGYDDNLQAFYIQDPSVPDMLTISYQDFEKVYCNNQIHSIAVIPKDNQSKLSFLNKCEDDMVRDMLVFMERLDYPDQETKQEFYRFIKSNQDSVYVNALAIKMLHLEEETPLLTSCIQQIQSSYPDIDYFHLISAHAYVKVGKMDEARDILSKVKSRKIHFYFYILGRISYELHEYQDAILHFQNAIDLEPDHYDSWSYISLCLFETNDIKRAFKYSNASLEINNQDYWNRMNHAYLLYEDTQYTEARHLYHSIIKDFKTDAHAWYQRARCDKQLQKFHQALRGFNVARSLSPSISYPYVEIAHVMAYSCDQPERAIKQLEDGLELVKEPYSLLIKLGELYEEQGDYQNAINYYERAKNQYPEDAYPVLSIVKALKELGTPEQATDLLLKEAETYNQDCEFLINGGEWLFINSDTNEELGLSWLENGIRLATNNHSQAWDLYVRLIEETPYNERGRSFLESLLDGECKEDIDLICYTGCLYEKAGEIDQAMKYYHHALTIRPDTFPFYRLGEVELNRGHFSEAKRYYTSLLELDETFVSAYLRLARIASEEENKEIEQHYLYQLLKHSPYDVNASHFANLSHEVDQISEVLDHIQSIEGQVDESWRLYMLGELARVDGNLEKQQNYLERAVELGSTQYSLLESYAVLKYKQQQFSDSLSIVLDLVIRDKEDRDLYKYLIDNLVAMNLINASGIKMIDQLDIPLSDKSYVYMYTAYELEQRLLQLKQQETSLFKNFSHRKLLKLYEKTVIALYELGYSAFPENTKSLTWLCEYYFDQGRVDEAIEKATIALSNVWDFEVAFYLAQALMKKYYEQEETPKKVETYHLAENYLLSCLDVQPNHPDVLYILGKLHHELERYEQALVVLEQAIELNPHDHDYYFEVSRVQENLENFVEAEKFARMSVECNPEFVIGYNQVSTTLHQQGRTQEALEVINQLMQMEDDLPLVHYNKACYLSTLNIHVEEAFVHLQFSIVNDPDGYFKELAVEDVDLDYLKSHPLYAKKMKKLLK
ncbi:tetratricopeptide repeat protein [Bacillus pinisoli]|uniref:tetratricopeptide repeat protein n=1 Tax=Bacillus pinisoli TaxID=2901866 RepID=UPI001FF1F732|nr:tetratricopeptide repeat protein [Bacillus pinisoli]